MNRIHIFVPVYFRERTVRKCVTELVKTAPSPGYDVKVVLIDNNSNDSLREFLKECSCGHRGLVETMLLDQNYGKARAVTMATKKFPDFDWFINFDSDIFPLTNEWPGILTDCYRQISKAGMVATSYVSEGNNPMPKQPNVIVVEARDQEFHYHWGGSVAGGCFVTGRNVWDYVGYRNKGVYGGVDGIFRQITAEIMARKCGFVEEVVSIHVDGPDQYPDYWVWKMRIQNKIRAVGPLAKPEELGNDKGFQDWEGKDESDC